mmetsp:Transcript_72170/g.203932  ORF Transcript_72170/g.203932 Transcript_72170/m.203932 type:complete len:120 (+) Transcript_72170:1733-2092(+)
MVCPLLKPPFWNDLRRCFSSSLDRMLTAPDISDALDGLLPRKSSATLGKDGRSDKTERMLVPASDTGGHCEEKPRGVATFFFGVTRVEDCLLPAENEGTTGDMLMPSARDPSVSGRPAA